MLAAVGIALSICEGLLRLVERSNAVRYSVWPPGIVQVIETNARDTPGLSGRHDFRINAQGYRGSPIGDARLRITAFGGSTTESLFVPEERSWPHLLEQRLARTLRTPVWVGNFGKSGRTSRQHVLDAKYVLPQFSADVALFLVGVNDLGLVIYDPKAAEPLALETITSDAYVKRGLEIAKTTPSGIRLLGLLQGAVGAGGKSRAATTNSALQHVTTDFYRKYRKYRAERAGFTSTTPDLAPWLDEYARNMSLVADLVRASGVLPVFVSQPTMWSPGLPDHVEALFWWGSVAGLEGGSGKVFYSSEAMEGMMAAFNGRLRALAQDKHVPFIDAAELVPKDAALFYDDMHYNEAGSRALADIMAHELAAIAAHADVINER
jgi:lysophospholipase L1-like esterase